MNMSKRWFVWRIVIMSSVLFMSFVCLFSYEVFVSSKALYKEKVREIENSLKSSLDRLTHVSNFIEYSDSIRSIAGIADTSQMNRDIYSLYFKLEPNLHRIWVIGSNGINWKCDIDGVWVKADSTDIKDIKDRFKGYNQRFKWSKYYIEDNEVLISTMLQNGRNGENSNVAFFDFKGGDINNLRDYQYIDKESFAYIVESSGQKKINFIIPFNESLISHNKDTNGIIFHEKLLNRYLSKTRTDLNDGIAEFKDSGRDYYVSSSAMDLNGHNVEYGVVLSVRELVQEYRTSAMAVSVFLFIVFGIYLYFVISSYIRYRRELDKEDEDVSKFIRKGESATVEFKSSLRWDYVEEKPNKVLEDVIMKTLAAFNNSDGGRLFIGVKDDGTPLGLEPDYYTLKGKDKDYFELHLRSLISTQYGMEFCSNGVVIRFPHFNGVEICEVKVRRGIVPLYSTGKSGGKDEKFYIRSGNSSREIDKPSEIMDYIIKHWKK